LEAVREYAKGQELFAAGKLADAIPAFITATKLDPDFGRGFSRAATAANNLGQREDAARYYDLALGKIDRMTEREKFRTRGQYYLFSRNPGKAIEELTALVDKYPSDVVGMSNLANAHSQLRQFDQAVAIGSRVAAMFPQNPLRQNNVALYAMYAGKFDEAIAGGKKAAELNKDYALAWVSQGLASEALGKYDDAAAAFKQLSSIAGWQARAALGMADLAMLPGRTRDAAVRSFEQWVVDRGMPGGSRARHGRSGDASRPHQRCGCGARADADPETAATADGARAAHGGRRAAPPRAAAPH